MDEYWGHPGHCTTSTGAGIRKRLALVTFSAGAPWASLGTRLRIFTDNTRIKRCRGFCGFFLDCAVSVPELGSG